MKNRIFSLGILFALAVFMAGVLVQRAVAAQYFGAIQTTLPSGTKVNGNIYQSKADVWLTGGPQNQNATGLPDGNYYFQVTDPNGGTLLSNDNAVCRQVQVVSGKIDNVSPADQSCAHTVNPVNAFNGSHPVQLIPYDDTPNNGGEYKVWLIAQSNTGLNCSPTVSGKVITFTNPCAKTDNFKVREEPNCSPGFSIPGQDGCFAAMPVHKTIAGRTPNCVASQPDVSTPPFVITTDTCTDDVVGSVDRVCTIDTSKLPTDPLFRSCVAANVNYLNVFRVGLFFQDSSTPPQPAGFPNALASLWIPPTELPPAPWGAPFAICELNIPAGWYLPDNGVTTLTNPGNIPGAPTVYTPTASTNGDRSRCWNVVIPSAATFEIFVNNVPTGRINVSKTSHGGDGTFTFTTTGSANSECNNATTTLAANTCTIGGLPATFTITTLNGVGNPNKPFVVAARTLFPAGYDPYGINETPDPLWSQFYDATCASTPGSPVLGGFVLAPGGVKDCTFNNIRKACTATLGGWGAKVSGGNPASILNANFPADLFEGHNAANYNNTFSNQAAVAAFMTWATSTPGVLTSSKANPSKTNNTPAYTAGTFGSQVLALNINLLIGNLLNPPNFGTIAGFVLGGTASAEGDFTALNGQTVAAIALLANDVLGGNTAALPAGWSVSRLNDLVNLLNKSFDKSNVPVCSATPWAQTHLL